MSIVEHRTMIIISRYLPMIAGELKRIADALETTKAKEES